MRDRIAEFVKRLKQHDSTVCGELPAWIVNNVAEQFSTLLASDLSNEVLKKRAKDLAIGAVRYTADQCGSEGETLLKELRALIEKDAE